jgi:hypothetical protein
MLAQLPNGEQGIRIVIGFLHRRQVSQSVRAANTCDIRSIMILQAGQALESKTSFHRGLGQ